MTIHEIISNINDHNEEATIYAKKENGKFLPSSEAVLVEIPEDEDDPEPSEIANKYGPGYEYFIEIFIIQELLEDLEASGEPLSMDQKVAAIIHYEENDAFPQ